MRHRPAVGHRCRLWRFCFQTTKPGRPYCLPCWSFLLPADKDRLHAALIRDNSLLSQAITRRLLSKLDRFILSANHSLIGKRYHHSLD